MKSVSLIILLLFVTLPFASLAEKHRNLIQVRNASSFDRQFIQIRDQVCSGSLPQECRLARHLLDSSDCKKKPRADKCREAKRLLESGSCVEGLVYEGWLEPGGTVEVLVCADRNGNAEVTTRAGTKAWTRYSWLDDGATVEVR